MLKGITAFLFFLLFVFLCLIGYVIWHFEGNAELPAECGLVFGAAVHSRANPGPAIERRVETAVRLVKEGTLSRIFFTGGKGSELQESEAFVMRKFAMLQGIDPAIITLEERSKSTWQNLQNSKSLVEDCESVIAISDRYHLARIELLADMQGWENLHTYPADRTTTRDFETRSIIREAMGIVYYKVIPWLGFTIEL